MLKTLIMKAALIALVGSISFAAHAIADAQSFDVPAGDLIAALESFAKQADVDLVYQDEQVKGLRTKGVSGNFSAQEAITKLLEGTPLQLRTDEASGAFLITTPTPSGGPASTSDQTSEATTPRQGTKEEGARPRGRFRLAQNEPSSTSQTERERVRPVGDSVDLGEIVVTGSRVRRRDEGSVPVTTITAEQIALSGQPTIARVLQRLPQNFGAQSDGADVDPFGGNVSRGSGVNLRGQGFDSTLVLVNGRRLAKNSGGLFTDISGIPVAAIDRVEVLPDGASAIYGADAIGGVVNIIMGNDFEGFGGSARFGAATEGGYDEDTVSAHAGFRSERGRLTIAVERFAQDDLIQSERDFTGSGDYRTHGGTDQRSANANPGNVTAVDGNLDALSALVGSPVASVALPTGQNGTAVSVPSLVPLVGARNLTYLNSGGSLIPEQERYSLFASGEWNFGNDLSIFLDVLGSTRESVLASGIPSSTVRVAAANPFNPFGETVRVQYAFTELGSRIDTATADAINAAVGLRSERLFSTSWNWELAGFYGTDDVHNVGDPFINSVAVSAAAARTGTADALNVFGDGSAATAASLDGITGKGINDQTTEYRLGSFVTEGPLLTLPAGTARASIGAEYSDERIETSQVGTFVVPFLVRERAGDRQLKSVFAELSVPLLDEIRSRGLLSRLELSLAGRYDDFSDFGSAFSPKVGLALAPVDGLIVRGSWGESFKAPLLRDLHENTLVFVLPVSDPARGVVAPVALITGGNLELQAETAQTWNAGISYERPRFAGLNITLNYFNIEYENRIIRPFEGQLLGAEAFLPAGVVVRAAPTPADIAAGIPGALQSVNIAAINLSVLETSGVDLGLNLRFPALSGDLSLSTAWTRIIDYKSAFVRGAARVEQLGVLRNPQKDRLSASAGWSRGAFSTEVRFNYSSSQVESLLAPNQRPIDDYGSFDVVAHYSSPAQDGLMSGVRITLGATNVTDEDPPFVNRSGGYDALTYDPRGRVVYLSLGKSW